jgi:hypothetical protein
MTEERGCPIPCRVIDPYMEPFMQGGRDEWRTAIVTTYPQLFHPPIRLPECREGWRYIIEDACKQIGDALRPEEGDTINLVKKTVASSTSSGKVRCPHARESKSNKPQNGRICVPPMSAKSVVSVMPVSTPAMAGS